MCNVPILLIQVQESELLNLIKQSESTHIYIQVIPHQFNKSQFIVGQVWAHLKSKYKSYMHSN